MTQELLERTVRDWVFSNPERGARELERLAHRGAAAAARSPEEVADALIQLAGRLYLADSRIW